MLHQAISLYASPDTAGGDSLAGPTYRDRVVAGDCTILDEFVATAIDELIAIRNQIEAETEASNVVGYAPGTTGKIETMAARVAAGLSPFVDMDGPRATG